MTIVRPFHYQKTDRPFHGLSEERQLRTKV